MDIRWGYMENESDNPETQVILLLNKKYKHDKQTVFNIENRSFSQQWKNNFRYAERLQTAYLPLQCQKETNKTR